MPLIKYIDSDGNEFEADVSVGSSVMQGAVDNMIDGILAECGGAGVCATCHCYVDDAWANSVVEAGQTEKEMLAMVMEPQSNSRLSCQMTVTDEMDGLVISLPASQY